MLGPIPQENGPFTKLSDEAVSPRLSRRDQERQLKSLLEAKPTEEQLQLIGEPSLKAARVLGEARLATKSVAGLAFFGDDGHFDPKAVRRANRELIDEQRRRRSDLAHAVEATMGKPSQQQLDYPLAARKRPIPMKALSVLGDDDLAMAAKMQVPLDAEPAVKALKVFGAAALAPEKARRILGSSDEDGEVRAMADRHWVEEMQRRKDEFNKEVISRKPSESLGNIPLEKGPVPMKALQFFGDDRLRTMSLKALKSRAPPKAVQILGEAALAGRKAEALMGGSAREMPRKRKSSLTPLLNYRKLFRFAMGDNASVYSY